MTEIILLSASLALTLVALVLLALLLRRPAARTDPAAVQTALADALNRAEQNIRAEFNTRLDALRGALDGRFDRLSATLSETLAQTRTELNAAAAETRKTLDARLDALAAQNAEKLEQMRQTVDEKLQSTLEKRLGESFKLVGDNLERVIKSLGEMQAVASDVGDLKRVLANVKTRGTWGETQLALLLENFLQADQYERNVKPNPRSDRLVEFAVKLPGRDDDGKPVWLPIDSKFPREDYERLVHAADRADAEGAEQAGRALAASVESFARDIRDKYISPPHTTDFAVLFLPTEGLYAEVLRRPGLADKIQRDSRVLIAGPTTLAALLNSLQLGFRTLAIQKRSAEVWKTLGAVKTQFGLFGGLLDKVQKKLEEAGKAVGDASNRHRVMTGKLSKVEALPAAEASALTGLDAGEGDESQ
jgi:DNA recombination protein RmuC